MAFWTPLSAGDDHTGKQRYRHMPQVQTQQLIHLHGSAGVPRRRAQGITHFTSEKLPLLSAASTQGAGNLPSRNLLAATAA